MSSFRRYGVAALAICLGVAVVPDAPAADRPAPSSDSAALSVYVESVPTAQGPKPFWGLPSARPSSLPRAVRRRIDARGGTDASTLRGIEATAPVVTRVDGAARRHEGIGDGPTSWSSSLQAAAAPAALRHRAALAVVLLATTVLLWAAAARRRREASSAAPASTMDASEDRKQMVTAE
jgi:hypothetical protein